VKIKLKNFILIFLLIVCSCDTFDSNKQLTGRYYLRHTKFGKSISYRVDDDGDYVELINGAFGPIGFDDKYIIVEKSRTEYLIIAAYKGMNYFPEKGILGPFSLSQFNQQKVKLKIRANFTINTD